MSEYTEIKKHFRIGLVQGTEAQAPPEREARWRRMFQRVNPLTQVPSSPRLVNAFKIGADPELVFEDYMNGVRADADACGFKTGLAYGADMNGRLVELRPAPSRFALEVVASILAELRTMAWLNPRVLTYYWHAGGFMYKDGLGGHVHFGRKAGYADVRAWRKYFHATYEKHRGEEPVERFKEPVPVPKMVKALDLVMNLLRDLGVFNADEIQMRQRGDAHGQQYGLYGDIRLQGHGFEYRAFPSWMDSPWMAYLVLVLSKLVVYDPDLLPAPDAHVFKKLPQEWKKERIAHLLAYYKGVDDDAALAYQTLIRVGLPRRTPGDFKKAWGIQGHAQPVMKPQVIPTSIPGSVSDVAELFALFTTGAPLCGVPQLTWNAFLPAGYEVCLDRIPSTRGMKGMGELLWDICQPQEQYGFSVCKGSTWQLSRGCYNALSHADLRQIERISKCDVICGGDASINVPAKLREPDTIGIARKALLCGVFPLWDVKTVKADSLAEFKARKQPVGKGAGKLLFRGE